MSLQTLGSPTRIMAGNYDLYKQTFDEGSSQLLLSVANHLAAGPSNSFSIMNRSGVLLEIVGFLDESAFLSVFEFGTRF